MTKAQLKAVLGPTNTGKTHLAIERMCAHSSGTMGFPLRLLAREVYERVVAIKGREQTALITGEERIEPAKARYFLCTAEAMPRDGGGTAFVALDEAQLGADRERGHIFTDRLLNARGREETMLLGSATLEPVVRALEPKAELVERPRFSTLTHIGPRKLSRLPPRSAIVAFSVEQVYAVAEMLRRYRGGAAVVMGALSPETRNKQVALFQNGEVDYIVATDAIGMGLNLDLNHVAFAGLSKYDGVRQRRLMPAEMAQIAGRAGRHQRDGTFGVLSGGGSRHSDGEIGFTDEEIYAIEEHRFAPLTHLYWRNAEPRFDDLAVLLSDLEERPQADMLRAAPEALDVAVLKRLLDEPLALTVRGAGQVRRFWEACSLPDFRQQGVEMHARFIVRLWKDLQRGHLGADYVAARIAELDNVQGDIDTLQGRIAAIRSWAYICQRPDWVLARDEMAARARGVEAKLSDALHARLTERFVNRRTTLLMKSLGQDAGLLPIAIDEDATVRIDGEELGRLEGFRFVVDSGTGHDDRKMLLAAAERSLPALLAARATKLADSGFAGVSIEQGRLFWEGQELAELTIRPNDLLKPQITLSKTTALLPETARTGLLTQLQEWLAMRLAPIEPLAKIQAATNDPDAGSQARALLHTLIEGHGYIRRDRAGIHVLPKELRPFLRRLGVVFGALDVFVPALLKPAARQLLHDLQIDKRALQADMASVVASERPPSGYRRAGSQAVRVDVAEKLIKAAFEARGQANRRFLLDPALAISTGLTQDSWEKLLDLAGFRVNRGKPLPDGMFGPARPDLWDWRSPNRRPVRNHGKARGKPKPQRKPRPEPAGGGAFAGLADLLG